MSQPQNILAQFSTYSYHHIFIACDCTATAAELSTLNEVRIFERRFNQKARPGENQSAIDEKYNIVYTPSGGKYIIIIDGMTDAEFIMNELTWTTFTAANVNKGGYYTSVASEGSFSIEEPRGIRFMNILDDVCNTLDSDPQGITWMIKTIFVGHTLNSQTQDTNLEYIANIPPLLILITDITGQFTVLGGTYHITFANINNGASRLPQTARIVEGINVNLTDIAQKAGGKTLSNVIKYLEAAVNAKYNDYYNKVIAKLRAQNVTPNFKKVVYRIGVDTPYDGKEYLVDDANDGDKKGDGIIAFGDSPTLEGAITEIMARCSRVKNEASTGVNGKKFIYKIFSTIESTQDEYIISYKIRQYPELQYNIIAAAQNKEQSQLVQQNLIEFDYIFTGKNTDILNMDIKMEMGLAFFQTLTTTDSKMTQREQAINGQPRGAGVPANDISLKGTKFRVRTPLFPDTTVKNDLRRNVGDPGQTAKFEAAMARHAGLEQVETSIEIAGNPNLITSLNPLPADMMADPSTRTQNSKIYTDKTVDDSVFPAADFFPALAKINIRMPASLDNLYGDTTEPFWYQGLYYIVGAEHTFKEGRFTQTLDMQALPSDLLQNQAVREVNLFDWATEDTSKATQDVGTTATNATDLSGSAAVPKVKPKA